MTFESWLRKQKCRDDAIGDLSKDFIFDAKLKYRRDRVKIKLTLSYLRSQDACDDAIVAYKKAIKEFKFAKESNSRDMGSHEP